MNCFWDHLSIIWTTPQEEQELKQQSGGSYVRWNIEKRVLERIGNVVRMGNERVAKVSSVFRWYEGLEGKRKEEW